MKLPPIAPVTINGNLYTVADLVTHVTTKEHRYNATLEDARQGKRTREAIAAGADISAEDLKRLADVLNKPSCGWGDFVVDVKIPKPDGKFQIVERRAQFPTHQFLPLTDPIQAAAASVS